MKQHTSCTSYGNIFFRIYISCFWFGFDFCFWSRFYMTNCSMDHIDAQNHYAHTKNRSKNAGPFSAKPFTDKIPAIFLRREFCANIGMSFLLHLPFRLPQIHIPSELSLNLSQIQISWNSLFYFLFRFWSFSVLPCVRICRFCYFICICRWIRYRFILIFFYLCIWFWMIILNVFLRFFLRLICFLWSCFHALSAQFLKTFFTTVYRVPCFPYNRLVCFRYTFCNRIFFCSMFFFPGIFCIHSIFRKAFSAMFFVHLSLPHVLSDLLSGIIAFFPSFVIVYSWLSQNGLTVTKRLKMGAKRRIKIPSATALG